MAPATGTDLAQAQRDVAGSRRHVDHEVVEVHPPHFAEKLLQRAVQHRSAPDDRRIVAREETHRDHLKAVLLRRDDLLAVGDELRLDAQHDRHVRPVDVGVDHADLAARLRQRNREVHGDGRLADAAFAGADRDDVLHARQRLPRAVAADGFAHARAHRHVHAGHAGQLHHRGPRLIAHLILHRARRRREFDRERDAAVVDASDP